MRVEVNKTILKPEFRHYLNPILVNVAEIDVKLSNDKNMYVDPSRKNALEPLKIRYDFLGKNQFVESERFPTETNIELNLRHVFLMGLETQVPLKEYLMSKRITVEIHDRDEIKRDTVKKSLQYLDLKEPEPIEPEEDDPKKKGAKKPAVKKPEASKKPEQGKKDVKKKKDKKKDYVLEDFETLPLVQYMDREFGVAHYFLKDLLNPYSLKFERQSPICPRKVFVDEDRDNLDLNHNARKKAREVVKGPDYFSCVGFNDLEFSRETRARIKFSFG